MLPTLEFNKLVRIIHAILSIYGLDATMPGLENNLVAYLVQDARRATLTYEKIRDIIMEK